MVCCGPSKHVVDCDPSIELLVLKQTPLFSVCSISPTFSRATFEHQNQHPLLEVHSCPGSNWSHSFKLLLIINEVPYPEKSMPDFSFFTTKTPHVTGTTGQRRCGKILFGSLACSWLLSSAVPQLLVR